MKKRCHNVACLMLKTINLVSFHSFKLASATAIALWDFSWHHVSFRIPNFSRFKLARKWPIHRDGCYKRAKLENGTGCEGEKSE